MANNSFTKKFSTKDRIANIHITKTAGTTFRHQMATRFDLFAVCPFDDGASFTDYYAGFRNELRKLRPILESQERYFLTGHYRYRDVVEALGSLTSEISLVTFIRNPIERTLSDYYYSRSEAHSENDAFRRDFPTLESYIENEGQMNKQLMYLAPESGATVDETIAAIEDSFSFVGITELYAECEKEIFLLLGTTQPSPVHMNKNTNRIQMLESVERYQAVLADVLHDEIELYNYFYAKVHLRE